MSNSYVLFRLGKVKYALKLEDVIQIVKNENILEVPRASRYVIGVINLRGEVFPVIDLRKRFGMPVDETEKKKRIIIVRIEERTFGILVDDVREIIEIDEKKIERGISTVYGLKQTMINGIVKEESGIIILLNMKEIIESKEEVRVAK